MLSCRIPIRLTAAESFVIAFKINEANQTFHFFTTLKSLRKSAEMKIIAEKFFTALEYPSETQRSTELLVVDGWWRARDLHHILLPAVNVSWSIMENVHPTPIQHHKTNTTRVVRAQPKPWSGQ